MLTTNFCTTNFCSTRKLFCISGMPLVEVYARDTILDVRQNDGFATWQHGMDVSGLPLDHGRAQWEYCFQNYIGPKLYYENRGRPPATRRGRRHAQQQRRNAQQDVETTDGEGGGMLQRVRNWPRAIRNRLPRFRNPFRFLRRRREGAQ